MRLVDSFDAKYFRDPKSHIGSNVSVRVLAHSFGGLLRPNT